MIFEDSSVVFEVSSAIFEASKMADEELADVFEG